MLKKLKNSLKIYISKAFFNERKRRNLTQPQMAELLHISYRSYSNIERGLNLCRLITFFFFLTQTEDPHGITDDILAILRKELDQYNNRS